MSNNLLVSGIALALDSANSFDDFKVLMADTLKNLPKENFVSQDAFDALSDSVAKNKIIASENKAPDVAFDPCNMSQDMVRVLGVTNGMPTWLIMQRYDAWKVSQG